MLIDTAKKRVQSFYDETYPVIKQYQDDCKTVITIDGNQDKQKVYEDILKYFQELDLL